MSTSTELLNLYQRLSGNLLGFAHKNFIDLLLGVPEEAALHLCCATRYAFIEGFMPYVQPDEFFAIPQGGTEYVYYFTERFAADLMHDYERAFEAVDWPVMLSFIREAHDFVNEVHMQNVLGLLMEYEYSAPKPECKITIRPVYKNALFHAGRRLKDKDKRVLKFELPSFVTNPTPPPSPTYVPPTLSDKLAKGYRRVTNKLVAYFRWWSRYGSPEAKRKRKESECVRRQTAEVQSGRKVTRAEREEEQRVAAEKKRKEAAKAVPKDVREREIRKKRDKRTPIFQSGKAIPVAVTAAATLGLHKLFSFLRKGSKALDGINGILDHMQKVAKALKKQLGNLLWSVPLAMTVHYVLNRFVSAPPLIVTAIVSALASVLGPECWAHLSKFFPARKVELQSGFLDVAPKLLATAFTFSVLGKGIKPSVTTELCKRISMFDRMSGGWDSFIHWVMQNIENLVNVVRRMFGKERIELFKSQHRPTYNWAAEVDAMCKEESIGSVPDSSKVDNMIRLIERGNAFKELYRGTTMERYVQEYLSRAVNALQPYQGAINARNNFRFEPACLMLYGKPGIGKTLMVPFLCAFVLLKSGLLPAGSTAEDVQKNIWQKGTSEFWNGYAGQECLIMDDAFQKRADLSDTESDHMTLIRAVSSWSFPLNFADLASKGKIYFRSKFIAGTTNLSSIDSEARIILQEPEAVARRLGHSYQLYVKRDYQTTDGKLDYNAFQRELQRAGANEDPEERFPWHVWEVSRHNFLSGETHSARLPLKHMLDDIVGDLRRRLSTFKSSSEALESFVGGFSSAELQSGFRTKVVTSLKEFRSNLDATCRELRQGSFKLKHLLPALAGVAGLAVTFVLVKGLLTTLMELISGLFSRKKPEKQSNRPLGAKAQKAKPRVVFQGADPAVASLIYANTYKMYVVMESGAEYVMGQVIFLVSDMAALPQHFSSDIRQMLYTGEMNNDSRVVFRNAIQHEHEFSMSCERFLALKRSFDGKSEIEFVRFENVRAHRRIVSNFMREADIQHLSGYRARLDVCNVDDRKKLLPKNTRQVFALQSIKLGHNLRVAGRSVSRYFSYEADTTSGDCGAPLCVVDNTSFSGRTAMGLHVAGMRGGGVGYSAVLTQEMINTARIELSVIDDQFEEDLAKRGVVLQSGNELPFNVGGSFLAIGAVDKPVTICPKTSYYMTDLYGFLGDYEHLPAPLSAVRVNGEIVYPMNNAVKPYASPLLIYEQPWLTQALHVAMRPLSKATSDMPRDTFTFEQAVNGIPERKFRSIPRGTAAGFPYIYSVRDGKREFFGDGQDCDLNTPKAKELRERVEHIIACARKGQRLSHVFVDFLKDELRSVEKVEAVATRLISSAPLDYTIAWRMLFGAFSSAVMRVHTVTGMAPGICVYTDWGKLAEMLSVQGELVFDGDFKAFDSSEQPVIHDLILEYINRWYDDGPSNAMARRVLWLDLVHSRHIGGTGKDQRHIYQWNKSLPSGHPFTTIVNSMYSLTLLVGAYISLTGDLTGFWNHVSSVTYGDDNVSNVEEGLADVYNQSTVAKALLKEFSVKYTPGNKSGEAQTVTTLDDVTFLKRRFRCHENRWLCPMEFDSFLYTAYWCKNRKQERQTILRDLEMALEELSMHEFRAWDEYAPQIEDAIRSKGEITRALCEQDQYLNIVLSRDDNWY